MTVLFDGLLRGLEAAVLKGLQDLGPANPLQGENPISFCNVFFLSQPTVALAALVLAGVGISRWPRPIRSDPSPVSGERQPCRLPPRL
ncbi:MAG: hypothetical protein KME02_03155 [Aphanothece saxicola GSE-SYN-MK-01-06B]|nr:hypothetical protein [Aphanothece saxicola GSE-SYN-MK-01-06B]